MTTSQEETLKNYPRYPSDEIEDCPKCEGTGEIKPDIECKSCQGSGIKNFEVPKSLKDTVIVEPE